MTPMRDPQPDDFVTTPGGKLVPAHDRWSPEEAARQYAAEKGLPAPGHICRPSNNPRVSTCDCGRPVKYEVPPEVKVKAVFGAVDPLLSPPEVDEPDFDLGGNFVDKDVYPDHEAEAAILHELMGESYVDATRQLLNFAQSRADKGHIREFHDRDLRKDGVEELADFVNYTLWALRRGDDPCPNRLGNALRHVVAAYHELLQED